MKQAYLKGLVLVGLLVVASALGGLLHADNISKIETELSSALLNGETDKANKIVQELGGINDERAMKVLINQLNRIPAEKPDLYWIILKGMAAFTDEKALDGLATFIIGNKGKPVGKDALFILKSNQTPAMVKLLINILDKGGYEQKTLALDYLGGIKTKTALVALIDFLKTDICTKDEDIRKRAISSIQALSGKEAVGTSVESVNQWWSQHKNDEESALFAGPAATDSNTGTAVDQMDAGRYMVFDKLRRLPKDKIIVINNDCPGCEKIGRKPPEWDHNFDHIEKILERMNIPHTVVKKSVFDTDKYTLTDKVALIDNCNQFTSHCICPTCQPGGASGGWRLVQCTGCDKHIPYENKLSNKGVAKIKEFVANGGYFFSEDAIMKEVLVRAFPGIVSTTKDYDREKHVTVLPGPGATTHPYLKGVFEKPVAAAGPDGGTGEGTISVKKTELKVGEGKWKIDAQSPNIKIDKSQDVTILMVSPDLKTDDPNSGAVAITFSYGQNEPTARITGDNENPYAVAKKTGGQVMHVLSHFGHQSDPTDEFVLQNLILNFLMEAAERYYLRPKK